MLSQLAENGMKLFTVQIVVKLKLIYVLAEYEPLLKIYKSIKIQTIVFVLCSKKMFLGKMTLFSKYFENA